MTVEILGPRATSEHGNAERLKAALIASAPGLADRDVRLAIIPQVFAKGREIDCVLIYEDSRPADRMFRTASGLPVHSFVACVEVKNHSPDAVRRHGTHLEVEYGNDWHNVTAQAEAQVWALKAAQQSPYFGRAKRDQTYIQSVVWLPRVPSSVSDRMPANGRTKIYYTDLTWQKLIDGFTGNSAQGKIQTLVPEDRSEHSHSYGTLVELFAKVLEPTKLDLMRVNALTQKRFDAEKQAYIRNLGQGLLMFRGRAGTGKTFALIQMAIHLGRQGKSTRVVTYNHGLISDMARSLNIIRDQHSDISPIPAIETRWMLMHELFTLTFGEEATSCANSLYDLKAREALFLRAMSEPNLFLQEKMPCCAGNAGGKKCFCTPEAESIWADVSEYRENVPAPYEFLLVDEGQDWSIEHRDLMYRIFGAERVIVADGVDQFVDNARCDWDEGDIVKNRIVPLRTSRRTKASTCDTITDIANALHVPGWDVETDQSVTGGRVTVFVEPQSRRAIERALEILDDDLASQHTMRPVDALICFPQPAATPGANYCNLFENLQDRSRSDYWRGYDWETRKNREYPSRQSALRAVLYQSCRGMEGWTALCMGLDLFYNHAVAKPEIDAQILREKMHRDMGLLFTEAAFEERLAAEKTVYALNWLMIPLTRSMDHLVIHLTDADGALGRVLQGIDRDKINWK